MLVRSSRVSDEQSSSQSIDSLQAHSEVRFGIVASNIDSSFQLMSLCEDTLVSIFQT